MPELELSPKEAQRAHEAAILATLPVPKWKNISSRELYIYEDINELEGASEKRVEHYRATWTPALVGALTVHQDGASKYGIIDGRHRKLAVKGKPVMFHCAVFSDLTREQVGALFLFHNQHRRNPSVGEKYQAAVFTGDPVATAVAEVIAMRGVGAELRAFGTALGIVAEGANVPDGANNLSTAIRWLTETFPRTDARRLDSTVLRAVGRFAAVYAGNPRLNEKLLQKALTDNGKMTAAQLKAIGVGLSRTSGPGGAAAVFRYLENRYADFAGGNRLERA